MDLPFIRISPDHGPNYKYGWQKYLRSFSSLYCAINFLKNFHEIRSKKSLGQNFLIDDNVIKNIVNNGDINEDDIILEVGPGTGNLTIEILKKPKKLY